MHGSLKMALDLLLMAVNDDAFGELRQSSAESVLPTISNKVFVVHGHDSALKAEIEQFLSQVGLEAVVLHRQPDQGQTIIEKFEKFSDVGYAIILLTPMKSPTWWIRMRFRPSGERLKCAPGRT